jgi:uncharacterized coiled-coil protein SlyX
VRQPTRRQVAGLVDRMSGAWRARQSDTEPARATPSPDPALERRLTALDARMAHLEAQLEALQDELYRQSVRGDVTRAELHERTDPERIARDLSADARRRGL